MNRSALSEARAVLDRCGSRPDRHALLAIELADVIADTDPAALRRCLAALEPSQLRALRGVLLQR